MVKIGMATDFGKIAELTQQVKEDISPLQKELNTLTKQLSVLAVSIGLIFFFWWRPSSSTTRWSNPLSSPSG